MSEPIEVPREEFRVSPRVFAIPSEPIDPTLVSVMMPFDPAFNDVFHAIRTATESAGFRCERADDVWIESTIIQDVFSLVYRSRFVIVDLTNRNSNVLYETGIAHTLGRPVVPIAQDVRGLPFDLAQHRTLEYRGNPDGLRIMMVKIERRLRQLAT